MKTIVLALYFLSPLSALAFYGSAVTSGAPESVCRVRILKNQKTISICTGTLIEKNKIITADHCVLKYPDIVVDCGFTHIDPRKSEKIKTTTRNTVDIGAPQFEKTARVTQVTSLKDNDYAVLTLDQEMPYSVYELDRKFNSSLLMNHEGAYQLRADAVCEFAGYGLSGKNGEGGFPFRGQFLPQEVLISLERLLTPETTPTGNFRLSSRLVDDVKLFEGIEEAEEKGEGALVAFFSRIKSMTKNVAPGDSGGAIYCHLTSNPNKKYVLSTLQGPGQTKVEEDEEEKYTLDWAYRMTFFF